MATKNLLQAIQEGLAEEMRSDESVMVLGEDVGRAGGVFRMTQGLQEEFGAARVLDTPLAESLIVGSAIGLSVNGMRPVAEIQFADFIAPAFDQIVNEAAKFYYRSNGDWKCPITIRAPYGVVPGGPLPLSGTRPGSAIHQVSSGRAAFPADAKAMIQSSSAPPTRPLPRTQRTTAHKEHVPEEIRGPPRGGPRPP